MEWWNLLTLEHQKETAVWFNHFYYNRGCQKKERDNETARKVNWIVHKNAWAITVEITINLAGTIESARGPFFIMPNSKAQTIIWKIPCLCTFSMWLKPETDIDWVAVLLARILLLLQPESDADVYSSWNCTITKRTVERPEMIAAAIGSSEYITMSYDTWSSMEWISILLYHRNEENKKISKIDE